MFLFKKLLTGMLMPLSLTLLLLLAGLLLLWLTRRQKTGKVLVTLGVMLLLAQAYGWGFEPALEAVERRYSPVVDVPAAAGYRWVVVLGGGTSSDAEIPLYARLSDASQIRLMEGVRLYRQIPGAKLLVSGGAVFGSGADGQAMQALAQGLGVKPEDIVLEDQAPDTETQAVLVRKMAGNDPVILVTSASHMQRAVGLFQKAGVNVLPAPTHYLVQHNGASSPTDVFPDSNGVMKAQRALYEYLGMAWAKWRGAL
jgi:uncharacterized SAM-binding protein YcdF (DUF218 family)